MTHRVVPAIIGVGLALVACSSQGDTESEHADDARIAETVIVDSVVTIETQGNGQRDLVTCGSNVETGESLAMVDIGATDSAASVGGISPRKALDMSGISSVPVPSGNVEVVEYSRSYSSGPFETFIAVESMAFMAVTTTPLDAVRQAIVEIVEDVYDTEFTATDGTTDDETTRSTRLVPTQAGADMPFYEIHVSSDLDIDVAADVPADLVTVRIFATTERSGPLPPVSGDAPGCLDTLATAVDLGWTLDRWKSKTSVVDGGDGPSEFLALDWTIGDDTSDLAEIADSLADRLVDPTEVFDLDDRKVYLTGNGMWSVIEDESRPGDPLRATFRVSS